MTTLTFDTHEFVKELTGAGFSEQQAEVITKLQKATSSTLLEELATKRDLKDLEKDVELKISESKAELIRWVVGVGVLQITLITGLLLKLTNSI